ncbi:MAG: hypothetical protein ABI621_13225 [Chloroflexota bacterium]
MNIQDIIKRIRHTLGLQRELPSDAVLGILRVLEDAGAPGGEDISCGELYAKLDEYVEREANKKDAAYLMPVIREHLDLCPECCEEYEALLEVLSHSKQN